MLARLIQAAGIELDDVVLEIGTGTGYGAAVLSRLAGKVTALESDSALAKRAAQTLGALGIDNVAVAEGALVQGYPRQGPYDVILLGGGVEHIPPAITDQLAEGGRLLAVVIPPGEAGRAVLATRIAGTVSSRAIFDAASPILPGFTAEQGFVF